MRTVRRITNCEYCSTLLHHIIIFVRRGSLFGLSNIMRIRAHPAAKTMRMCHSHTPRNPPSCSLSMALRNLLSSYSPLTQDPSPTQVRWRVVHHLTVTLHTSRFTATYGHARLLQETDSKCISFAVFAFPFRMIPLLSSVSQIRSTGICGTRAIRDIRSGVRLSQL